MALSLRRGEGSRRDLTSVLVISVLSILCLSIGTSGPGNLFGVDAALIPSHDSTSWDARDYDFSLDFWKRDDDVCSETLPGSVTSMCTPSNTTVTTLCCVRPDSVYPQCGVYLGVGFCVVDDSGGSYTDSESVCDTDPKAVRCGTDDGDAYCCPEHTKCADDGWGDGAVRCEAYTSDLEALTATSTTSSTSTATTPTTTGTTTTTDSTATSSVSKTGGILGKMTDFPQNSQNEPGGEDGSDGLSGGAVAGIVVGVIVVLVIAALIAWFLIKRRKNSWAGGQLNGKGWGAYGFFASDRKPNSDMKYEMDAEDTAIPGPPHELDPQTRSRGSSLSRTPLQELPTPVQNGSRVSVNARPQSPQEMEAPISAPSRLREQESQS